MSTAPKPVQDRVAESQAIPMKGGSEVGGGCQVAPQTRQTTTGVKMGKVGKPIETRKGC